MLWERKEASRRENNMDNDKNIRVPELKPIYKAKEHRDFRKLLEYAASEYSNDNAFIVKTKKGTRKEPPQYRYITYSDFKRDVDEFGTGLLKIGLKGKRVAIIGKNSYSWYMSYYCVMCGIGICVPLDKGLPAEEIETSLIKSKADCLIFDKDHLDLVEEVKAGGKTGVETFIAMEEIEGYPNVSEIIANGKDEIEKGNCEFMELQIDPDALQVILFTSGTTSKAKAVMLTQRNLLSNLYMIHQSEDIRHGDINMAFLPYHHTFGSTGQNLMISLGVTTVFCDGLKYVQKNLQEYKVTVFVCVPLLIEAMYAKIMAGIRKKGMEKKFGKGIKISNFLRKIGIDRRRKLFSDILDELGGNLRFIVSGASALAPEVVKGFEEIGIEVVQGYGMTEASPVIAAENPVVKKAGSIGHAMPGVEVMIADRNEEGIGELICRGPNVMQGYYEDPEATDEILIDGWLHTGDLARVDNDGCIFLMGRKKNVIVLKNG